VSHFAVLNDGHVVGYRSFRITPKGERHLLSKRLYHPLHAAFEPLATLAKRLTALRKKGKIPTALKQEYARKQAGYYREAVRKMAIRGIAQASCNPDARLAIQPPNKRLRTRDYARRTDATRIKAQAPPTAPHQNPLIRSNELIIQTMRFSRPAHMKILMLNPPFFTKFSRSSRSPAISKGGCVYYPLWLGAATGWLEKKGHDVKLLDCPAQGTTLEEVLALVNDWKPDLIAVDTVTASYTRDQETLEALKTALPSAFVAMVGTHCSALPEETLHENKGFLDAVCRSEYDLQLEDLAAELSANPTNPDLEKIKGISFLRGDEVVHTPSRELISGEQLDEFPFMAEVYKKHLHIPNYFYPSVLYPEVTIVTGRGCPFYCTFCILPQVMNGHKYRARSPEHVVAELKWISENLPEVKDVMVEDDTFTADRDRMRKICHLIIDQGIKTTWTCNARADVDLETLKLMKQAGCRLMCVGFESADQTVLNNIKKGTVVPKIKQFVADAKTAQIQIHGCFMMGNRGETKETIQKTVDMAIELEPDTAQFFPIMVYPGTEAFRYAEEQGHLTTNDWNHWLLGDGTHNSVISTPQLSSEELVRECDKARIRFYSRPKFMVGKIVQLFTNPRDIPRILKSGWIFSKYYVQELRETWKDFVTKKDKTDAAKNEAVGA
jgi:radical SAM superfamily enzyme YgiQ (UPF0313 family)